MTCPSGTLKVQVKGTANLAADSEVAYKIMSSSGATKKKSIDAEVDVLACWIDPLRLWYLIPITAKPSKCVRLYGGLHRSSSRYEQYRDNWKMFYNH